VGYKLRREIMPALPATLGPSERLVCSEIADLADDNTRIAYGRNLLKQVAVNAGLANEKCVRNVLTRLAKKGVELRNVLFRDGAGRPVTAFEGHQTTFRVPTVTELARGPLPNDQRTTTQCPEDHYLVVPLPQVPSHSLTGGHAAPQTPLRHPAPSGRGTDTQTGT
jgi:hypothetical protein